jgi:hypothetical protein
MELSDITGEDEQECSAVLTDISVDEELSDIVEDKLIFSVFTDMSVADETSLLPELEEDMCMYSSLRLLPAVLQTHLPITT